MMRYRWIAAFAILLAAGCQDKVADENQRLYQQTHELQAELDQARAHQAATPDQASVDSLRQQLTARDAEIAQMQSDAARPAAAVQPGMAGVPTTYDPAAGTLTATVQGDVLFDPGTATLKESAKATLTAKIVSAIQTQYADRPVFVDGHTDTDPINRTKEKWADNRDLSYARAKAVTEFLITSGLDAKRITIRAFGDNRPKATKEASRRVEIVVSLK